MSNSMRGGVSFTTAGKKRRLALTVNAMCHYQDLANETVLEAIEVLENSPNDIRRLRRLFFVGLEEGEDFTEADAGDLIDKIGLPKAGALIGDAVRAAYPQNDASEETPSGNGSKGKARQKKATAPIT